MTTDTTLTTTAAAAQLTASAGASSLQSLVRGRVKRSLLLVDASGSMGSLTAKGERKIDVLRKVVKDLREQHPVPVAAFGVPKGVEVVDIVPEPSGCTPMHSAIDFGAAQGATHLIIVTDGQPDSEARTFEAAARFAKPIDVFYIGDGNDGGADFAKRLAAATGGTANVTDLGAPKQLTSAIAGLLGSGSVSSL
jgi:Mg-chelatase subunit ChlD